MNGRELFIAIYLEAAANIVSRRLTELGHSDIVDVFSRLRSMWGVALEWEAEGYQIDWKGVLHRSAQLLERLGP